MEIAILVIAIVIGLLIGIFSRKDVENSKEKIVDCSSTLMENVKENSKNKTEIDSRTNGWSQGGERISKLKGDEFEDYVADIFHNNKLRIKEWNKGSVTKAGAFAENALNPDMYIVDEIGEPIIEYWAECKFRSNLPELGFALKEYQLNRYKQIQSSSKRKILILLGVGGSPSAPDKFYSIPFDELFKYKRIPQIYLDKYFVENPRYTLRHRIRHYFLNDVFKKYKK